MYFEHRIVEFLGKYQLIAKDFNIMEQMEILSAGTHVMLTFGMRNYPVNLFEKIIIFPSSYYSTVNKAYHKGEFNPKKKAIVFSWEDFLYMGLQIVMLIWVYMSFHMCCISIVYKVMILALFYFLMHIMKS